MNDESMFWLVWNPDGSMPRRRHPTQEDAVKEAERLSAEHRGARFYVLQAVSVTTNTAVHTAALRGPIPF